MSVNNFINPILDKVHQLSFSDDSTYDIFSLANRVYVTIYTHGGVEKQEYLDKIKKVIETQIKPLIEDELTLDDKKELFNTAKTNLEAQIKAYSKQKK